MGQEYDFTKIEDILKFQTDHYDPAHRDYILYNDFLHNSPNEITINQTRKYLQLQKISETVARIIDIARQRVE